MRITKRQLKQIIKEELSVLNERRFDDKSVEVSLDEDLEALKPKVQRLYDEWQPQTEEGQLYKNQLGELL